MYRNQLSIAGFAPQLILSGTELLDAQSSTPGGYVAFARQSSAAKKDLNQLRAHAALSVTKNDEKPKYGVVWFQARTEVDKSGI